MTTRLELLQRWEAGLEANATPTDEESRFHWLRRVYVRIYSFLISRYASGDWRADSAADASEDVDASWLARAQQLIVSSECEYRAVRGSFAQRRCDRLRHRNLFWAFGRRPESKSGSARI